MESILYSGFNEAKKWTWDMIRDSNIDWNSLVGMSYLEMTVSHLLKDLKQLLDSKREKMDGLKRFLALIIKGRSMNEYFPIVIKNVANPNFQIRKFVYIILLKYAYQEQDTALLAINTLQKDMSDQNAFIRATALTIMSMIRIPGLTPLYRSSKDSLLGALNSLLGDKSHFVIGSAVEAFNVISPESHKLIHSNYHNLCSILNDSDEEGQVEILLCLLRYGRSQFVDPRLLSYGELHEDHQLLLDKAIQLLASINPSTVCASANLLYHLAPKEYVESVSTALVRIFLVSGPAFSKTILTELLHLVKQAPQFIEPFYHHFYLGGDTTEVAHLKLNILGYLISQFEKILFEFRLYLAGDAVENILVIISILGQMSIRRPDFAWKILKQLCKLLNHSNHLVANEAIISIQLVLSKNLDWLSKIIPVLIKALPNLEQTGKQSVYWLLGEYICFHAKDFEGAADILRMAARDYSNESYSVKLQIVNFGINVYASNVNQKEILQILLDYILSMAKFDTNIDVRDRARYFRKLLQMPNIDLQQLITQRPSFIDDRIQIDKNSYDFGTTSWFLGTQMKGYHHLPEFANKNNEICRGTRELRPPSKTSNDYTKFSTAKHNNAASMTLEDFLNPDQSDCTDSDDALDYETQDSTDISSNEI